MYRSLSNVFIELCLIGYPVAAKEENKLWYEIHNTTLHIADEERLAKSAIGVLEIVRIAAEAKAGFDKDTEKQLKTAAAGLSSVSPEDVRPAWREFISCAEKRAALEILDSLGGVRSLLAEVAAMRGVEQPPQWHPEGDVWVHTMLCMDYIGEADEITSTATLLHDVGKPPTFQVLDRIRFNKHEAVGGRIAVKVALRLGYSESEAKDIEWIVRSHMKFKHIREMRPGRLKNLVIDGRFEKLAVVVRADCLASHGDTSDIDFAVTARAEALKGLKMPRPLLRGRDLMEMGYSPGPHFGRALAELEEAQRQKKVKNKEEAKNFIKKFLG